jgi:CHAD domain-containing protein
MNSEIEHVEKALRDLGKSLKGLPKDPKPDQVHKLRTSARRVEAIAAALEEVDGKDSRRLVKAIEPLRKAAGGVRDMDVLTANLRKLARSAEGDSLNRLIDHLESVRMEGAGELRQKLDRKRKAARHNLKRYFEKVHSALDGASAATNGDARNGHNNGVNSTAKHLSRELAEWPPLHAQNIHDFRLKVKELRYILQLDANADSEFVGELGKAQRRIGEWHDWQQLAEIAHEFLELEADHALLAQIDGIMQQKLERALAVSNVLRRRYLRSTMLHAAGC